MTWLSPVDAYCERTGPDYWSEPINALTNMAFLIAALVLWPRLRGPEMAMGRALAAVLFVIGLGSWLFHTHANRLTGLMDVLPIVGFILLYVFAATRDYFGARPGSPPGNGGLHSLRCRDGAGLRDDPRPRLVCQLCAGAAADSDLCAAAAQTPAGNGARPRRRRRDPDRLADLPHAGSAPLRRPALRHAFPVACPQCGDAGLDDRGLAPASVALIPDSGKSLHDAGARCSTPPCLAAPRPMPFTADYSTAISIA